MEDRSIIMDSEKGEQIGRLDSYIKTVADAMAEDHRRTQEHARAVDERVDKLVIAIGELIRRMDNGRKH